MPTYVYQCKSCMYQFEKLQKMSDSPLTECPECGKFIEKIITGGDFVFKGSGFYITDYKKSSGNSPKSE